MTANQVTITPCATPSDLRIARELFTEYAESLGIDLAFQHFEEELASLPGKYACPGGLMYLALLGPQITQLQTSTRTVTIQAIGCVALRPLSFSLPSESDTNSEAERVCELKRLYVRPTARGLGAGQLLLDAVIQRATEMGYERMVLDTLEGQHASAIRLYRSRGFVQVDAYYATPLSGTLFMGKKL